MGHLHWRPQREQVMPPSTKNLTWKNQEDFKPRGWTMFVVSLLVFSLVEAHKATTRMLLPSLGRRSILESFHKIRRTTSPKSLHHLHQRRKKYQRHSPKNNHWNPQSSWSSCIASPMISFRNVVAFRNWIQLNKYGTSQLHCNQRLTFVVVTQHSDTKSLVLCILWLLLLLTLTEDVFLSFFLYFVSIHFCGCSADNFPLSRRRRRFAKPPTIDKKEGKVPPLPPPSDRWVVWKEETLLQLTTASIEFDYDYDDYDVPTIQPKSCGWEERAGTNVVCSGLVGSPRSLVRFVSSLLVRPSVHSLLHHKLFLSRMSK